MSLRNDIPIQVTAPAGKWIERLFRNALEKATWSKDPNRQVGCVIIDDNRVEISGGYNGFPRGIKDDDRLLDRETKLKYIVHAEINAICNAARTRGGVDGGIAIITRPVCSSCADALIQSGIKEVYVTLPHDWRQSKWQESCIEAEVKFKEVGIEYHIFEDRMGKYYKSVL